MQRRSLIGLVATALVLSGAAAVTVASHGSAPSVAQSTSYDAGIRSQAMGEWDMLNSAISGWGSAMGTSLSQLASMHQETFGQTRQHGKTYAMQRGIVVFASQQFLILRSENGSLRLWTLSGRTQFRDVATSMPGMMAMTASPGASGQAVDGEMIPAVNMMVGDTSIAQNLLTPDYRPQTVMVHMAGTDLTVTVTITRSTANLSQTATMPAFGAPVADPVTMTTGAFSTAGMMTSLARGDLAMVVGTRSHGLLRASIVLYTPLTAANVGGFLGGANPPHAAATPTIEPTHS